MIEHGEQPKLAHRRLVREGIKTEMVITETARLRIRPLGTHDVETMCQVLCDPEVMLFSMGVKKAAEVRGWIEERTRDYARRGFGLWAVVPKTVDHAIGYCGLTGFPNIDGRSEIEMGLRLAREFWSRGYGTESAIAVREYALGKLALSRLIALVDPGNAASIRLMEKIGMTYEKDVMMPGYDHTDRLYVIQRNGTVR
jgi:RimJ/RimL family protein N-acetyltransferase